MSATDQEPRRLLGEEGPDGEPITGPLTVAICSRCVEIHPNTYHEGNQFFLTDFGPGVLESIDPKMQCEDCGWSSLR